MLGHQERGNARSSQAWEIIVQMQRDSKFPTPYWSEWSDRIIQAYNLKRTTARGEYHGPCPCCGGVDRFWISELRGEVKAHCRQGCNIQDLSKAMIADGVWPTVANDDWPKMTSEKNPFSDVTPQPYNVRKGVELIGAMLDGDTVVVPIFNSKREKVGIQRITPDGQKRFSKGMEKEGAFGVVGKPEGGTVYIAEGWATSVSVHMATGRPCIFALDAGNLPKVAKELPELFPDVEFVVAADNDEKGIDAAKATGFPYVLPERQGDDWNDVMVARGKEYTGKALQPKNILDELVMISDAEPLLRSNYLVKGWLGREQLSVAYGPSNVGKSFFMLDLAYHIAANKDWHGSKVRGGAVLYLATEGGQQFRNRAWAVAQKYKDKDVPLAIRAMPVNLLDPAADLPHLMQLVDAVRRQFGDLSLIVVDTLSRAMAGGNENGPEDMTAFINNIDLLREHAKASVAIVHHSGKDTAAGARGHSSLRAATDTEIELSTDGMVRIAKATKQRDMETGKEFGFTLDTVELGIDEDGDKVTTCTIQTVSEEDMKEAKRPKPSGNNKVLMEAFWQLKGEGIGHENPAGAGWPDSGMYWVIEAEQVREHFFGKLTITDGAKRSAWKRCTEWLCNAGYMHVNENKVGLLVREESVA